MSAVTQAVTTLTAVGALVFTGLSLAVTRDQVAASQAQNEVARQGQLTGRYTTAVEQLSERGPDRTQVRLGGIYELGRLAHESPADQAMVADVLSSFLRTAERGTVRGPACATGELVPRDVQAALTVLGSRDPDHDGDVRIRIDLSHKCLREANLSYAALAATDLRAADLRGAELLEAKLAGADLTGADLTDAALYSGSLVEATLSRTNLSRAHLFEADLAGAQLHGANLTGANLDFAAVRYADLSDATLAGACLFAADLHDANLVGADLRGADLGEADLRGADLTEADLTGADLTDALLAGARIDPVAKRTTVEHPGLERACDEQA
ncbi:MAG TPA: pentapeptide repeat-containing protein [Actinophytocola sp.]|jgi:uncharacterized protein YjbI with pentapeptide repeats|nr:pentapeptide repeat-containing protein [Actinophytocola sp.]